MKREDINIELGIQMPKTDQEIRMEVWRQVVSGMEIGSSFLMPKYEKNYWPEPLRAMEEIGASGDVRLDDEAGVYRVWRTA